MDEPQADSGYAAIEPLWNLEARSKLIRDAGEALRFRWRLASSHLKKGISLSSDFLKLRG